MEPEPNQHFGQGTTSESLSLSGPVSIVAAFALWPGCLYDPLINVVTRDKYPVPTRSPSLEVIRRSFLSEAVIKRKTLSGVMPVLMLLVNTHNIHEITNNTHQVWHYLDATEMSSEVIEGFEEGGKCLLGGRALKAQRRRYILGQGFLCGD